MQVTSRGSGARRRRWSGRGRCALRAALALGAALALCGWPAWRARVFSAAELRVAPAALAHLLADFSVLARLHPAPVAAWWVERDSESGNYSAWQYTARYACGARCEGRARVTALADHADHAAGAAVAHGAARAHRVLVQYRECRTLPLLPWPALCDEWHTDTAVEGGGGKGARLEETAERRCGVLHALGGACRRALRQERDGWLRGLRALLARPGRAAPLHV